MSSGDVSIWSNIMFSSHVIVIVWFLRGIIPHQGHNPYTLDNHSIADLYYDAANQTLGEFSTMLYYAALEYMWLY